MAFSELESEGRIAAVQVEGIKAPLYMLTGDIIMKEKIDITDYANLVTRALPKGILLNTNGERLPYHVCGRDRGCLYHPVNEYTKGP